MIERLFIKTELSDSRVNYAQFLKHHPGSKTLVVIFPGGDNSTDIPTLHYARKTTLLLGCDILSLHYGAWDRGADSSDEDAYKMQLEECYHAINQVNPFSYEKVFFISKSYGNSIALDIDDHYFNSKINHVFYTPITKLIDRISQKNCLVLTGSKDHLICNDDIESLMTHKNIEVHQFADAVHSLEINDNVDQSLTILREATALCRIYIEKQIKY